MVLAAFILPIVFLCLFAVFAYASRLYENVRLQGESRMRERTEAQKSGVIAKGEADFIRQMDLISEEE